MAKKLDDDAPSKAHLTPETFLEVYRAIRLKSAAKDKAVGELRAAKKMAKAAGVDLDALAMMEALNRLEPEIAEARIRAVRTYRAWDGGGEQIDLFGDDVAAEAPKPKAAAAHTEFKAEETGYARGKAGDAAGDCPHPQGSPLAAAWVRGWSRGQESIAMEMAPGAVDKKASTSKRMRTPDSEPSAPVH